MVLVITGCDIESPMDTWVKRNEEHFRGKGYGWKYADIVAVCTPSQQTIDDSVPLVMAMMTERRHESRGILINLIERWSLSSPAPLPETTWWSLVTRIWNWIVNRISQANLALPVVSVEAGFA